MVKAWYINDNTRPEEQQLELHLDPPKFISIDDLKKDTGVLYWQIDVDRIEEHGLLGKIRKERGYSYEDLIEISRDTLPDYDKKIKSFYEEHFHADEEIRYVLGGSGYFDVRDRNDSWVRIEVIQGDLIVLPSGIHHRFTLDTNNYVKVMRLFIGVPVWTAYNRPNEEHEARKRYVQLVSNGFEATDIGA